VGGVVGKVLGDMSEAKAQALINQAMDATGKIDVPALEALMAEEIGPSAFEQIKTDARLKDAQYGVLGRFREMYDQGGMDLEDRANLNRVTSRTGRAASASRNAIQGNMDARGMGGSGASYLLQQKAAQDQAQDANQAGMDMAGQAMRRRFEAMKQHGNMAGQIRGQEYGEQSNLASARDSVNRYNAQARESAGRYRNQMKQQDFANRMSKQGAMNNLAAGKASQSSQQGQNDQNLWAGLGNAAGTAVNGYAQNEQAKADRQWEADEREKDRRYRGVDTTWGG
jgi:hypothetical protein